MKKFLLLTALAAGLVSCDDFLERDLSEESVEIISPTDEAVAPEGEVGFLWNLLDGAVRYRLVIVSPTFESSSTVINDLTIVPDSAALSCFHKEPLSRGSYQWSLTAHNAGSSTVPRIFTLTVFDPGEGND